jgi:hypothetical protein
VPWNVNPFEGHGPDDDEPIPEEVLREMAERGDQLAQSALGVGREDRGAP